MKKIMIVAAHPDDEILGCGAQIAKLIQSGHDVKVVIAGEGVTSRNNSSGVNINEELDKLKKSTLLANSCLGVTKVEFLDLPDNKFDSLTQIEITKKIESLLGDFKPSEIYTHFPQDLNKDHRMLSEAVITAARTLPGQLVKKIYYFEVLSSTHWNFSGSDSVGFNPNTFSDVSSYLDKKMKALKFYDSEMRDFPHARSYAAVEALAKYRGALAGYNAAEAFILARELVD